MAYNGPQLFSEKELLSDDQAELQELGTVDGQPVAMQTAPDPDEERQIAEAEREIAALRQQTSQMQEALWREDERQKQIDEAHQCAQRVAQEHANPRPEDWDPVAQRMWDRDKKLEQLNAAARQQVEQLQQFQRASWHAADQQQFLQVQPDYIDAANYIYQKRLQQLQESGYPAAAAQQIIRDDANLLRESSRRFGKPFAPALYNLARVMGYTPHTHKK